MNISIFFQVKKFSAAIILTLTVCLLVIFSRAYAAETRPSLSGLQNRINALELRVNDLFIDPNQRLYGLYTGWAYIFDTTWKEINFSQSSTKSCVNTPDKTALCIVHLQLRKADGSMVGAPITSGKECSANWTIDNEGKKIMLNDTGCLFSLGFTHFRMIVEILPPPKLPEKLD